MDERQQQEMRRQQQAQQGQASRASGVAPRFDSTFTAGMDQPATSAPEVASPSKPFPTWRLALGAAGAVIAGLAGYQATKGNNGDPVPTAAAVQQRLDTFLAAGPLKLPTVPVPNYGAALSTMQLPPAQRQALELDLAAQKTRLVVFTLWDDLAEDNDVVELKTEGFSRVVALTKAPQDIVVPVPFTAQSVDMIGTQDGGGGGITVAVKMGAGPLPLPYMTPGEKRAIPVAPP